MEKEEFRPIPELPGYFISNQGRVRRGNTKILRPFVRKYDEQYQVTADGVRHQFAASKMVKRVFGETEKK